MRKSLPPSVRNTQYCASQKSLFRFRRRRTQFHNIQHAQVSDATAEYQFVDLWTAYARLNAAACTTGGETIATCVPTAVPHAKLAQEMDYANSVFPGITRRMVNALRAQERRTAAKESHARQLRTVQPEQQANQFHRAPSALSVTR